MKSQVVQTKTVNKWYRGSYTFISVHCSVQEYILGTYSCKNAAVQRVNLVEKILHQIMRTRIVTGRANQANLTKLLVTKFKDK